MSVTKSDIEQKLIAKLKEIINTNLRAAQRSIDILTSLLNFTFNFGILQSQLQNPFIHNDNISDIGLNL